MYNCTQLLKKVQKISLNGESNILLDGGSIICSYKVIKEKFIMFTQNVRLEVMQFLEKNINTFDDYFIPVEKIWQPTDLLPDSQNETFYEDVRELREIAKDMPYDFWVALVGDTITEEALLTYEL